ncbi:MAG: hypothetical protein ACK559_26255, partial [bacterium]
RQREQVAGLPGKLDAVGEPRRTGAPHHEEQLAGGVGVGDVAVAGADVHETGAQPRRGGGARTAEDRARVERNRPRDSLLVQFGSPLRTGDRRQRAVGQRVGGVAVVVEARGLRQSGDDLIAVGGWHGNLRNARAGGRISACRRA